MHYWKEEEFQKFWIFYAKFKWKHKLWEIIALCLEFGCDLRIWKGIVVGLWKNNRICPHSGVSCLTIQRDVVWSIKIPLFVFLSYNNMWDMFGLLNIIFSPSYAKFQKLKFTNLRFQMNNDFHVTGINSENQQSQEILILFYFTFINLGLDLGIKYSIPINSQKYSENQ